MLEDTVTLSSDSVFCTFRVQDRLFGINVAALREISTNTVTTPVPQSPPAVRGLAHLRSRVFLVIDLRPMLGLKASECTADSRLIILKPGIAEDVGVLVDGGGDIVRVSREQIEPCNPSANDRDSSTERVAPFVVAIGKLDRELLMIVDVKLLVDAVTRAIR